MKRILNYRTVPRWVIMLIDVIIISWSFTLSYFVAKHFELSEIYRGHFLIYTSLYCVLASVVFYLMKIHTGLIRYSNMQDVLRIFSAILVSSCFYPLIIKLLVVNNFNLHTLDLGKVLLMNFFISFSILILLRTSVKETFHYSRKVASPHKEKILIYGTNNASVNLKQAVEGSMSDAMQVIGFVDIHPDQRNLLIEQKKVYNVRDLSMLKHKLQADKLLLLNEQLGNEDKQRVIDACLQLGISLVTVPPTDQWANGRLSLKQIKNLKIEDLLHRDPIKINTDRISADIAGKRVLVTGAAGSIGSEVVRQVLSFNPSELILCDQAESALHDVQLEIQEKYPAANITIFIGNVQNTRRMSLLFREHKPQIVFHAAAYKHVPMMENNPSEAILTNIMGTKIMADMAVVHEAEKFVMISTDKAVRPTNVMGASKRIAEMYTQSLNGIDYSVFSDLNPNLNTPKMMGESVTRFITTRFGNVLDSNGSVIPRFRGQIEKGGPVTVTHPEITRYFMTIPEAVQLVLEAGATGEGGEIFVFDMGKPVKIANLAVQMIKLAGLEPGKDIQIVYSGLRPGEKLYEELLNEKETTLPTHHEKIKRARVMSTNFPAIVNDLEELILMSYHEDDNIMVHKMKQIVPDFISNNSIFAQLDQLVVKQPDSDALKKPLETGLLAE